MSVRDVGDNVLFLGVARAGDKAVVAVYTVGSRSHNASIYLLTAREVLDAPDFSAKVAPGSRYRLASSHGAFCFLTDDKWIYFCITSSEYPQRLSFPMLEQLRQSFSSNGALVSKGASCREFGLNKKLKGVMSDLVTEYDDPAKKDKLSQVQQRVDTVKLQMHSNIESMLQNCEKAENLEKDTQDLENGAKMFSKSATSLKKRELWKSRKLTMIIALIVAIILAVLIFTLVKG